MTRLIDADVLIEVAQTDGAYGYISATEIADILPIIEFEEPITKVIVRGKEYTEVIKCKDCKHWNSETKGCKRNPSVEEWCDTDHCSYGERKEP